MKRNTILIGLSLILAITAAVGCKNKRISYTDMIKREDKEIKAFMDEKGFKVVGSLPKDLKMKPNEFYEIKNEAGEGVGVWINVLSPGALKDMAESGKTHVLSRFSYVAIGKRMQGGYNKFSNIDPTVTDIPGVTFTYQDNLNADSQAISVNIAPAPNSSLQEENMQVYACNAMMLALKFVPLGSTLQMITSFREGPSFTLQNNSAFANINDAGVALYYDKITFQKKM